MKDFNIDMTEGRLLPKIISFSVPVMLSGILQLLYNASDMIVVGRFAEQGSLAAVGATSALINLIVNVFVGLSVGTCVVVARFYGQHDNESVSRAANTSILISAVGGVLLGIFGYFVSRPMLGAMGTPPDVIDRAVIYMQIYFIGIPVNMIFNFGSAVMRAGGDTKRPLYYLASSGIVNVLLNLLFVIVFKMGVAGVAWATIISQAISAALVLSFLFKTDSAYRISFKKMRIYRHELALIAKVGIPAGIQGSVFSISNVLIQSSINSFGSVAMDGNTAGGNLEGFLYITMNAVSQAALSFVSQNYGAVKFKRVEQTVKLCNLFTTGIGVILGIVFIVFSGPLLSLYNTDPSVIEYGKTRMLVICSTYFLCGIMEVLSGAVRGVGHSTMSMIVSLLGACAFRIFWIYTVFAAERTLFVLYLSYPVSWLLTDIAHYICYRIAMAKERRKAAIAGQQIE